MKKIKKLFAIFISIIMLLSLSGCSTATLKIQLSNGDSFKIKMSSNSRNLTLILDEEDNNLLKLYDNDEVVLLCAFQSHEILEEYVGLVISELESGSDIVRIEDSGEINGVKYTLISFEDEYGTRTYEVIGWIVGSNTGIIADGEFKNKTLELFETLTFKIKNTTQSEANYCFKNIDNFENLMN